MDLMAETLRKLGPERVYVDKLNMKPMQSDNFRKFLSKNYSDDVIGMWFSSITGGDYYYNLKQRIKNGFGKGLKLEFCY
jgi:hypothetical protein